MQTQKFEDIWKDIRQKQYYPLYLLMGEESFYIDVIADLLEDRVLDEQEKEFNLTVLYGRDTSAAEIVAHARRYPMMAPYHLVIIREAQHLKDLEPFVSYTEKPLTGSILVLCYKYKSLDKRTRLYKNFVKQGAVFEGKKLYDNQVPDWISNWISRKGYRIGAEATQLLADHLGNDLNRIVNEAGKVFLSLKKGQEITPALIESHIGISKDFNIFEFQKALGQKNMVKAYQIAAYFADNPKSNPLPMTLAMLYQFFSKLLRLHASRNLSRKELPGQLGILPVFLSDYEQAARNYPVNKIMHVFSILRQADLQSKGVGNVSAPHGEILKELTYKMLH